MKTKETYADKIKKRFPSIGGSSKNGRGQNDHQEFAVSESAYSGSINNLNIRLHTSINMSESGYH